MTLSIMENHDAIKTALKDYQQNTGEIPKVLERYLEYVARTGKPLFSWDLMNCLVMKKFENVFDDFVMEKPTQFIKTANSDNLSVEDLKQECLSTLNSLTGVPFTIQRICELLLNPKKNYSKIDKFLRGFLRVIKVVTTVDRIGQKITTESQLFANALSPFGSGDNNWSGISSQSEESITSIHLHSPIDNHSIIDSKCGGDMVDYVDDMKVKETVKICLSADSMDVYSTKMIDQEQQTSEVIYSSDQYFQEQKTISMPPIGALFKPIDQLEAFVQNVSNQVESTSSKMEESKKRNAEETIDSLIDNEQLIGSNDDVQEQYISPAKKRKMEVALSQDTLISSTDVLDNDDDDENNTSINKSSSLLSNVDQVMTSMSESIEDIPTMSSQAFICAEEPSSTNEIKDNINQSPITINSQQLLIPETMIINNIMESSATSSTNTIDDDVICQTVETVAAACHSNNQTVEADQSNCDDDSEQESTDQQDIDSDKNESLSSNNNTNSIDEETGEHV